SDAARRWGADVSLRWRFLPSWSLTADANYTSARFEDVPPEQSFVPLAQEVTINQGPQAGQIALVKMSDYDEVDGLYFPFSMSRGVKDGPSQPIIIESIELNPEIEEGVFAFPEK
ncbi:MAG: hypothetical protein AAFS00_08150, partial [Bacteroidota bacterium]